MQNLAEPDVNVDDIEVVEEVLDFASAYVEKYGQGPLWLTGSALNSLNPGDYDIVVQRSFQEVPDDADYRVAAGIIDELSDEEIDYRNQSDSLERQLEACQKVDTGSNVNFYPEPVRRFQISLEDIEVDLSFNNERPRDEALKLIYSIEDNF